jgi:hypothetical protein
MIPEDLNIFLDQVFQLERRSKEKSDMTPEAHYRISARPRDRTDNIRGLFTI